MLLVHVSYLSQGLLATSVKERPPQKDGHSPNEKPIVWGRSFMRTRVLSVVRILDEWQADFAEALAPLSAILGGRRATPASPLGKSLDSLFRSRTPL